MHDAIAAEKVGTPAIGVMTTEFVDAAELMGHVLGLPGYEFATIQHPVSSATDQQLRDYAARTLSQGLPLVLAR